MPATTKLPDIILVDMAEQSDACMRAAEAAVQVVREECSGMDIEIRELDGGMFMEIPTDDAEMMDAVDDGEVSYAEFSSLVDDSSFIRNWLGGIVASEDVPVDYNNSEYAARVHTYTEAVFDEPLGFGSEDMVGTEALKTIQNTS